MCLLLLSPCFRTGLEQSHSSRLVDYVKEIRDPISPYLFLLYYLPKLFQSKLGFCRILFKPSVWRQAKKSVSTSQLLMWVYVPRTVKAEINQITGVLTEHIGNYFEVPIVVGRVSKNHFDFIVQKVQR